jgi:hypothetical protein
VRLFAIAVKLARKVTVDVLQGLRKSEGRRMTCSAQQSLDRARECEWMASQAKDRDAKAAFEELALQWQELARQKEDMERNRLP